MSYFELKRRYAAIATREPATTAAAAMRLDTTIASVELLAVYGSTSGVGAVAPLPGVVLGAGETDAAGVVVAPHDEPIATV